MYQAEGPACAKARSEEKHGLDQDCKLSVGRPHLAH